MQPSLVLPAVDAVHGSPWIMPSSWSDVITRSSPCLLVRFVVLIACITGVIWPASAIAGGASPSSQTATHLTLRISPPRVSLGQSFTVTLSGAQPGLSYSFVEQPAYHTGDFGGGIMGQHRADGRGVVRFMYLAGTQTWEAGPWRITAGLQGKMTIVATATVTVVRRPLATATSMVCSATGPAQLPSGMTLVLLVPAASRTAHEGGVQLCAVLANGTRRSLYRLLPTRDVILSADGRLPAYRDTSYRLHLVHLSDRTDYIIGRGVVPRFSSDGRYVAFITSATLPLPGAPSLVRFAPAGPRFVTVWASTSYPGSVSQAALVDSTTGHVPDLGPALDAFWVHQSTVP